MKIHFITFANTTSDFCPDRIIWEAENFGKFDTVYAYTENDFNDDFLVACGDRFEKYKRGYGYWSWKPYIILDTLNKIDDGDIVVYADCGCQFVNSGAKLFDEWVKLTIQNKTGILSTCNGPYLETGWTKIDTYDYINSIYNIKNKEIFWNTEQIGSGVIFIYKNENSVKFTEIWKDIMLNHFDLCTDSPSHIKNTDDFCEHRHDQSIFSLLGKIYDIALVNTRDGILNMVNSPIIASRLKTDKNTWHHPDFSRHTLPESTDIKVALCAIAKRENNYIREWVEHYEYLGIDKIYLYDNNDDNDERFEDVINDYIESGFVDIINIHNKTMCQRPSYNECIEKHGNEYDWIGFLDIDEYIVLHHDYNIKDFLSRNIFDNADVVTINWRCYDDIGITGPMLNVINNDYSVRRFVHKCDMNKISIYNTLYNAWHKSFAHTRKSDTFAGRFKGHTHAPESDGNFIVKNSSGTIYKTSNMSVSKPVHDLAEVNHYMYKTIEEFTINKLLRGYKHNGDPEQTFDTFFRLNEKNIYNLKYADTIINRLNNNTQEKNIINENPDIDIFICTGKDFDIYPRNGAYKIIAGEGQLHNKYDLPVIYDCYLYNPIYPKEFSYAEGSRLYYIWMNMPLKKYVGFCQYRRYFSFYDNVPDVDKMFKENNIDAILIEPINNNIIKQYQPAHNIKDLQLVCKIINMHFHKYYDAMIAALSSNVFYASNIFIMKSEDFNECCKFVFNVLQKFDEIRGFVTDNDTYEYVKNHLNEYYISEEEIKYGDDLIRFQQRIDGYLLERIMNIFYQYKFKNVCRYKCYIPDEYKVTGVGDNAIKNNNQKILKKLIYPPKNIDTINVFYEPFIFNFQSFGGISEYIADIIDNDEKYGITPFLAVCNNTNVNIQDKWITHNNLIHINNIEYAIHALQHKDFDILHVTYYSPYFMEYLNDKPYVLDIHDMIPELYPQYFKNDITLKYKRILCEKAAAIFVPTECTKRDLINIYNVPDDKIYTVGRGISDDYGKNIITPRMINDDYILYVGNRNLYKRFDLFMRDITETLNQYTDLKVVCTGPEFNEDEINTLNKYGIYDKFIHIFAKNNDEMASLYKYATVFVYPSEYEGFGYPILEAYACGCPVMLNNKSCFQEVAGNAAIWFDSNNTTSDFTFKFNEFMIGNVNKEELLNKQYERLKMWTMDSMIKKITDVYKLLMK